MPVSAGPGTQRLFGKATVTVAEVGTQTRGIAEELWDQRNNWPEGGKVVFRRATPELFPPPIPIYDQFQVQLGRIRTAGREIEKFKQLFTARASLPASAELALEADFQHWREELKAAEDAFWELNCPDPALRAQERLRANFRRVANQRDQGTGSGRPKPPPPPGPPPPLDIFTAPITPFSGVSAAKILPANTQVIIESFEHNRGGRTGEVSQVAQVAVPRGVERISIKARLQLPSKSSSLGLGPNPRIQEVKEKEANPKEEGRLPEIKALDKEKGPTHS